MNEAHQEFWREAPALLIGVSALVGIGFTLFDLSIWFVLFWLLYVFALQKWTALCFTLLVGVYAWSLFGNAPKNFDPIACSAHFSISSLQPHQSPFHRDLLYQGSLYFQGISLPCTIFSKKHIPASCDYYVTGTLSEKNHLNYVFKAHEWTPIKGTWSLAELRYTAKETYRNFLNTKIKKPRTADLLASLSTGEVTDRMIRFEFGKVGVQHLLAVSGFHFGILIVFLSYFFSLFLTPQWKWAAIFVITTIYFLFIGPMPAVQRAWITVALFALGKTIKRPIFPINLLGAALLIELLLNPLIAANPGFQFSFTSTFGILTLHRPIQELLYRVFLKRTAEVYKGLSLSEKSVYMTSSFFRNAICLNFAVTCMILPLVFYHFNKFPLLSLVYNLFYPVLVGMALFGLLISLIGYVLIGPYANPLFSALDWFTRQLLDLTTFSPFLLDYSIAVQEFPYHVLPVYLFCMLLLALNQNLTKTIT